MELDVLVRNGRLFDGGGGAARHEDLGVKDGRIVAIGPLGSATAALTIDAAGLCVAPGFIDVHAHSDLVPFFGDDLRSVAAAGVLQGVTTEVPGNCGASPFPRATTAGDDPYLALMPADARRSYATFDEYRTDANDDGALHGNLAPLIGHGSVRSAVVGTAGRRATPDEIERMRLLVSHALEEGAFGVSTGLVYAPGMFADAAELTAVAREAALRGRPYTTHLRDEGDRLPLAVEEALAVARRSGVALQLSHHKATGRRNWGRPEQTLQQIVAAREAGLDVMLDSYPYTAGSTLLGALLPPWAFDGGFDAALAVVTDTAGRDRLRAAYAQDSDAWQNLPGLIGWDAVVPLRDGADAGRSIGAAAREEGRDPVDVLGDLLLDDPTLMCLLHGMDERDVATIAAQPFALIGSDGVPLPSRPHPRLAGTFARVLRLAGGDEAALADLVRRATSLSADRFGIPERGRLALGMVADVVVFNPAEVRDRATYVDPLVPPDGVPEVLVAGVPVVRGGRLTGAKPGRVLSAV